MIAIQATLTLRDRKIVPVRAIPFLTGAMTPRMLVAILANPELPLSAYVFAPNEVPSPMAPKEWKQFLNFLAEPASPDKIDANTIATLPASTFVDFENLWRTYEEVFNIDREALVTAMPGEQENAMLREYANVPSALAHLIMVGFESLTRVPQIRAPRPIPRTQAQDDELLAAIRRLGHDPQSIPKNPRGKPGVKAAVRKALGSTGSWTGTTVFDKCWERLRKSGEITDAMQ